MPTRNILITCNYQTAGLTTAMRYRLPAERVFASELPGDDQPDQIDMLRKGLPNVAVWITTGH